MITCRSTAKKVPQRKAPQSSRTAAHAPARASAWGTGSPSPAAAAARAAAQQGARPANKQTHGVRVTPGWTCTAGATQRAWNGEAAAPGGAANGLAPGALAPKGLAGLAAAGADAVLRQSSDTSAQWRTCGATQQQGAPPKGLAGLAEAPKGLAAAADAPNGLAPGAGGARGAAALCAGGAEAPPALRRRHAMPCVSGGAHDGGARWRAGGVAWRTRLRSPPRS